MQKEPLITLRKVCAGYGGKEVLRDIDLTVYVRDFLGILRAVHNAGHEAVSGVGITVEKPGKLFRMSGQDGVDAFSLGHGCAVVRGVWGSAGECFMALLLSLVGGIVLMQG